ncbi:L-lactate dehydrogenase [Oceanidesulfovibrio marinus]|uniref:L-lactate dehydrogenase n=1 Tax=Oceanidesulfovibrio marinus TaxID=370038 RepID=A0ABX6NJK7_9BACT|nr:L-lactate dehydrogenase [Oceanidesulfovibrio marinus]QJT10768.1 L-lactate dehydrogenase [Oceanidesulfovibrio marinus]
MSQSNRSKVAVIGAGNVGAALSFALTMKGEVRELAVIDQDIKKAEGEVMDLGHAMALAYPMQIEAGDSYELCAGARIVVVTAGAAQKPGETRLDLNKRNAVIVKDIVHKILEHNPNPILIMVTNPVDVMTYVALKESGLPPAQVISSGTVLDSARFRYLLANHFRLDPRNLHCHVIGEHGDSELAVWSRVNIAGVSLQDFCSTCDRECRRVDRDHIERQVRESAYEIIDRKGSTAYGIGLALVRIIRSILRHEESVLTVSSLVQGSYGIRDVCLSLPSIVGSSGVEGVLDASLDPDEEAALHRSAAVLREQIEMLGY